MNTKRICMRVAWLLCFTGSLLADPAINADDVTAWSVIGADKDQILQPEGSLNLVANGQLYRTMTGSRIILQVNSSPLFGTVSSDLPVIELGDAALTFLRSGAGGKLVVVLGNNPAIKLPFEIALDADGRSEAALGITFSRLGETVAVSLRGQTLQFPGGPSVNSQEIVLSAGETQAWTIRGLSVVSDQAVLETNPNESTSHDEDATESRTKQVREKAVVTQPHFAPVINLEGSGPNPKKALAQKEGPPRKVRLEIFTPPAVRRGRAQQVRQAAMEADHN